ncbi:hypothetical protein F7U66_01875 [Vibrio parahaemolyticus]|nr:hypothetical protein [Vibrio parahaemolyticus]
MEINLVLQAGLIVLAFTVIALLLRIELRDRTALERNTLSSKLLECSNRLTCGRNKQEVSEVTFTQDKNVSFYFRGARYTISCEQFGLLVLSRETTGITGIFRTPDGIDCWINDHIKAFAHAA